MVRDNQWLDRDAGPVVRPYALTGGRTRPTGASFDLLALVASNDLNSIDDVLLEPEHLEVMRQCRQPKPVADLASDLDLPLGVVRILLSDMRERGLVTIRPPARTRLTDPQVLKDVADALRRL
jgi:DNA-binding transcriptional ArsR family regulator